MKFCFLLGLLVFSQTIFSQTLYDSLITQQLNPANSPFYFGVASGDPQTNSVIIWTKVYSATGQTIPVKWQIAVDTSMQNVVANDVVIASQASAYTVKVRPANLLPNTTYFYRFETNGIYSPIGRTRTAPETADELNFAVVSCNNYEQGYFNAYRLIANRSDINAVVHLGDYIYEYGAAVVNGKSTVRSHIPTHEILSLQDYRSRYAQYRLDEDLQEAHRLHPFITEWDDHEFANDSYMSGAKNQQPEDGDWEERKANARKAYFEWLPITDNPKQTVMRKISYGNLADLFMLDGRVEGRSKPGETPYDTVIQSPEQFMLGREQTKWLINGVKNSKARWKVMANQVVFSELDAHQLTKAHAINQDAWDGYPVERKEILDSFYAAGAKNILVLTGDIHLSWAFDLVQNPKNKNRYNRKTGEGVIGAEFVTPSVSTNGVGERYNRFVGKLIASIIGRKTTNPHLVFQNICDHGYLLLNLTADRAQATWNFCKTIRKKSVQFVAKDSWFTNYNSNVLRKVLTN